MIKKVLLCAYACEPHKGSEPGVGWQMSIHLAKENPSINFYTLTRRNNQQIIEKEKCPNNLNFIYYDLPKLFLIIKKNFSFVRIYYYLWMLGATIKLWKRKNEFQIIHHITFVNDWFPSIFVLLKNSKNKFIWGPIGSNEQVDTKFMYQLKHKILEKIKNFLLKFLRRVDVFFLLCKRKSNIIIGTGVQVKNKIALKNKYSHKFICIPAIGISMQELKTQSKVATNKRGFTVISAGQLRYIKNFRLTITAFSRFLELVSDENKPFIKLQIIGNGDQKNELLEHANDLNVLNNIEFIGQVKQIELMTYFNEADVFLYPTLENAGFVILEAMSKSLPVVALNYGGPKAFVKKNKDLQLTPYMLNINEIERNLSLKILNFFDNRKLILTVGQENFKTVSNHFTWEAKAKVISNIYNDLIGR